MDPSTRTARPTPLPVCPRCGSNRNVRAVPAINAWYCMTFSCNHWFCDGVILDEGWD